MKFYLFSFIVSLASNGFSQEYPNLISNNEITTIAYWSVGDVVKYHFTEERTEFINGKAKPKKSEESEYEIKISVVGATDSTYTLELKYLNFKLPDESEYDELIYQFMEELTITYMTDELGIFDSIIHKDQLVEQSIDFVENLQLTTDSIAISRLHALFSNESLIEVLFINDIIKLHGIYGIQLKLSEELDLEAQYFTVNNIALSGTGSLRLNSISKEQDICRITQNLAPNRQELNNYLAELFVILIGKDEEEMKDFSFSTKTRNSYELLLSSGWMNKIKYKETAQIKHKKDSIKVVTSTVIELQ